MKRICDAEQATSVKVFQHAIVLRRGAPLITQVQGVLGEDPPRPILTWSPKLGSN